LVERGEVFAQLLAPDGRVLGATPRLGRVALLDRRRRRAVLHGPRFSDLPSVPGLDEGVRLLGTPVRRGSRRVILVVGATAENRREALRSLRTELLVAGPIALVLATGLGYLLAGAGLRTVEAMRRRAARISADSPGARLPVPATGDEIQRLATTLNDMLARLEAALERERGFVADAGHELRTPLALMRAELDFALHYATTPDELRAAIRTASDETDRLVALAQGLLLIASRDQGRLPLRAEPIRAAELLGSVVQRFAWRAEELGRPLGVVEPEDGLTVDGDRLRLEQALGNLVDNALRHGEGTVRLAAAARNGDVEISVADEGPGFEPEMVARGFERFSRGESGGGLEGSGLGLAIVKAIAEAHGGRATVANSEHGATVSLLIPGRRATGSPERAVRGRSRGGSASVASEAGR
jgi:signal transduction histidine kinase